MTSKHGTTNDGTPITDEMVEAMADEAEAGYDVDAILRRRVGRPSMGSAAASVESVRLDPELKRDLILRAADEHISVSEAIRRAVRNYLQDPDGLTSRSDDVGTAGPSGPAVARPGR